MSSYGKGRGGVTVPVTDTGSCCLSPADAPDRGTVQKVIVLPRDDLLTEELVLEEVEVFRVSPRLLLLTAQRPSFNESNHIE